MTSPMLHDESYNVELLQCRARQISNRSLQSTQRMVGLIDESQETATKVAVELDEQREKLERLDEENDEIREQMRQSENVLAEMEKWCGFCVVPWRRPKSLNKADKVWNKDKKEMVCEQPRLIVEQSSILNDLPRITNDEVEEATNENLVYVHDSVLSLKLMAAGMNKEVREHNQIVDKLIQKVDVNEQHVQQAEHRTGNIRKS